MNLAELHSKLIAAVRLQAPDDRVPYAFEKRITALIAARDAVDRVAAWSSGLWRAAISCTALAMVLGGALIYLTATANNSNDLSQDFENTLLASADLPDNSSMP
ncbi:MAG: hypothetical protein WCH99_01210 [Verrucomicrobiota bacterium]